MLLAPLLNRLIHHGRLTLIGTDGRKQIFGNEAGPAVTVRLHRKDIAWRLGLNPRLALGEAYMDGALTVEDGTIYDLLLLLMRNMTTAPPSLLTPLWNGFGTWLRQFHQYNPIRKSHANVAHHYDLSGRLYDLFLDADRQYSCAYFSDPDIDLEMAQANKKRHIAAKLLLKPGMKVLDIGSGWGGMALYLAREADVDVTGLTLSTEQHKLATERAAAAGLSDRVRFVLRDYREETGQYDRIVSVGMFEHVGVPHFQTYFDTVSRLLAPDGVMLLHAIGQRDGAYDTNPWIRKYIFPGGYIPALSEVIPRVERTDLWVTDVEIWRLHYAETLRHWLSRFKEKWDQAKTLYDERFCRMWEFYLAGCQASLRAGNQMVFQMQLAKQIDAAPIVRDYMVDWERAHGIRLAEDAELAAE